MKTELAVTTLALSCASAFAQAPGTLEVYGLLDVGINHVTGIAGGSKTSLASGIMDGSRLGVRGNEDIGGGWRSLFVLESRVEVNSGTFSNRPASGSQLPDRLAQAGLLSPSAPLPQLPVTGAANAIGSRIGVNLANSIWDRQVYVGLVTPVGALLAGHQYTPAYEVFATFDATHTSSSLSAGQINSTPTGVDIRADNALAYRIQSGGLTASLMRTFDGGTISKANRLMGLGVTYKSERFSVGAGYNTHNNELGQTALKSGLVGASLALGPGTLSGLAAAIKDDHPAGLSTLSAQLQAAPTPTPAFVADAIQAAFVTGLKQDARLFNIGYTLVTGALTSTVAYSRYDDRRSFDADVSSYGVTYSYALSKRTDINAVLTRFENKGLAQAAPGGGGFLGGFTATAGTDSNNVALGIRHRF